MTEPFINAIRALANSSAATKSKVGRIRDLLPDIKNAQRAGVRLADIAMALSSLGFEGMNLKCLQNLLYQARKQPKQASGKTIMSPAIEVESRAAMPEGINADSILEHARKSMQSKPAASSITLGLLRSSPVKSTHERIQNEDIGR